jgi:hypothetical protein
VKPLTPTLSPKIGEREKRKLTKVTFIVALQSVLDIIGDVWMTNV